MGSSPAPGSHHEAATVWRLHAIVRGRVQGVGFREFVRRRGEQLELGGWVRNLPDGRSVEVLATGPRERLELLRAALNDGPRMAHVSSVDDSWATAEAGAASFEIHY